MQKFNVKRNRTPGVCNAMRCKNAANHEGVGISICSKHKDMLTDAELSQFFGQPPKTGLEEQALSIAEPEKKAGLELLEGVKTIEIEDQDGLDTFSQILTEVKRRVRDLEEQRKKVTKPMLDAKRAIDDLFKPAIKAFSGCEKVLKEKIAFYMEVQRKNRAAALLAPAKEQLVIPKTPAMVSNITEVKSYDFEILDFAAVPRSYLKIDESAIRMAIKETDGSIEIPGVKIFQKNRLIVRTGNGPSAD